MIYNEHSKLAGTHALLSASKYYWLNYSDEDIQRAYISSYSQRIGTLIHELAASLIKHRIRVNKTDKHLLLHHLLSNDVPECAFNVDQYFQNFASYVNDAIQYDMTPEVTLVYSASCYGTADAIAFDGSKLRIHDLKTGITQAHMEQLLIYAALFCLEYNIDPEETHVELRLYQSNNVAVELPAVDDIVLVMEKITHASEIVDGIKESR